jgi:hypothetical protein
MSAEKTEKLQKARQKSIPDQNRQMQIFDVQFFLCSPAPVAPTRILSPHSNCHAF